jgi:glucokinase
VYLGIEIGGTKLQLGVGDGRHADLSVLERRDIDSRRGAAGILEQLEQTAAPLLQRYEITRVGIGFGGPVDAAAGRVIISHQIDGWQDFALNDWCRRRLGLPAVLGNDCDAAALAEARYGAGRGHRLVFYVTVGTGIGGGFAIDGMLHGAGRPAVAEIGHLRPGLHADQPAATVESVASGTGIAALAKALVRGQQTACSNWLPADVGHSHATPPGPVPPADRDDLIRCAGGDIQRLTARHVGLAAAEGNRTAVAVLAQSCSVLGWAIAQTITLLAPEIVVLGGGVSLLGEGLFLAPLRRAVERYVFPPLLGTYRIVPAALGEAVVVHGALALAAG